MKEMLESLETKLKDKSWTDTQEPEVVNLLESILNSVHNLATRTYLMIEIIDNFYEAIIDTFSINNETATSVSQNGNVYPESNTNFSEPA